MSNNPNPVKIKAPRESRYTNIDRSYYHRERSEAVSKTLYDVAAVSRADALNKLESAPGAVATHQANEQMRVAVEAVAMARRIWGCASKTNHFTASDLNDKYGECFDGFGILAACGHKLCHACCAKAGKRNRKEAEYAYKVVSASMKPNEFWRFITLTAPPVHQGIVATNKIHRVAWRAFVNSDWFNENFRASIKGIEFTLGGKKARRRHYHWHTHLLALGFFVDIEELKRRWTEHLRRAFIKAGVLFDPKTSDGLAVVHIKRLVDYVKNPDKEITAEAAISEVCKYITKSESWSDIPPEHLLEVASVPRWARMFSLTGACKDAVMARKANEQGIKDEFLSTQTISASIRTEQRSVARLELKKLESEEEFSEEDLSRYEVHNVRLPDLDSDATPVQMATDEELLAFYNPGLSPSSPDWKTLDEIFGTAPEIVPMKLGRENWRKTVARIGLEAYFLHRSKQETMQMLFRKSQMIELFPFATFTDHNGVCWHKPASTDSACGDSIAADIDELSQLEDRLSDARTDTDFDECARSCDESRAWIKKKLESFDHTGGEASPAQIEEFEKLASSLNWQWKNFTTFANFQSGKPESAAAPVPVVDSPGGWVKGKYSFAPDFFDAAISAEVEEPAQAAGPIERVEKYRLYDSELRKVERACRFRPSEAARANRQLRRSKNSHRQWIVAVMASSCVKDLRKSSAP